MMDPSGIDWEDALQNALYIAKDESFPEFWKARAAEFRHHAHYERDVSYGSLPCEPFDLFLPKNAQLGRTPRTVESESAERLGPLNGPQFMASVGGAERPEFLRQSTPLAESWTRSGASVRLIADADRHHFDVIYGLKHPDHPPNIAFAGA